MRKPRGIRNNNPLNIRIGYSWVGERPYKTDNEFEEFIEMKFGVRAAMIILHKYLTVYKRKTIRQIISSWAPSNQNNTEAYIAKVANITGKDPDNFKYEINSPSFKKDIIELISAMIIVENGEGIAESDIKYPYYEVFDPDY